MNYISKGEQHSKTDFDPQVNTAKAEAEMAYQLQASKVSARIKEEEMQVIQGLDVMEGIREQRER